MAKKAALLGMFIALAIVLGWLEALVPVFFVVPGMKLGLANVVTLFALYRYSWKEAFCVGILRVLLSCILFGNFSVFLYSLFGMVFSLVTMALLRRLDKFSMIGVSAAGGIMHNVGQLIAAFFVIENTVLLYYFPILAIAGVLSGTLIGVLGAVLYQRIPM